VGGGGGVSCFHGHLNKCPLGDLNKSPWENYLEGGGSEEIIKSTRFCKVHYVLNSDIKVLRTICDNQVHYYEKAGWFSFPPMASQRRLLDSEWTKSSVLPGKTTSLQRKEN
jgi:hypothetical protein